MAVCGPVCRLSVVALLVLEGCGQQEPASRGERTGDSVTHWAARADLDRGYSIRLPSSWRLTSERTSRISDPRELVSIGTAALTWHPTDCEAFAGAAGVSMGPRDVVLTVWERGYDPASAWLMCSASKQGDHLAELADGALCDRVDDQDDLVGARLGQLAKH
jgi:hypothetical protein